MKKHLLYIALSFVSLLWFSCQQYESTPMVIESSEYMQFSMRSGSQNGQSAYPCFIFWREIDYIDPAFVVTPAEPYVYCHPEGTIDTYKAPKYNTRRVYPPYSEWVHAVGVSPGSLVEVGNTNWKEFYIDPDSAGIIDIQCAPVIKGSQQFPFSDILTFAHQLTNLEIQAYCGPSMKEGGEYINVKDISISISSDSVNQWQWFPQKLVWNYGVGDDSQYIVVPYESQPLQEILAKVAVDGVFLEGATDTSKSNAKLIGNFYLFPGFNAITITVEATYVDSTVDGLTNPNGNGQEIERIWKTVTINDLHPTSGSETSAGESYIFKISFDRSKIELDVLLKEWDTETEVEVNV